MTGPRTPRDETSRADGVTTERRRRKVEVSGDPSIARFGITEDQLDHRRFVYRSVPDAGNRIFSLTQRDDYDFVTVKGDGTIQKDAEGVIRYQHGNNLDGSPQWTYLLRKPIEYAEEDRNKRLAIVNADEKRRLNEIPDDAAEGAYKPR